MAWGMETQGHFDAGTTSLADGSFSSLILEDDAGVAALLATIVRKEGGQPTLCRTVREADHHLACGLGVDVFILDDRLPDGRGSDFFFRACRPSQALAIMVTGCPEPELAFTLSKSGLAAYHTKPLDLEAFTQSLRQAISFSPRSRTADTLGFVGISAAAQAASSTSFPHTTPYRLSPRNRFCCLVFGPSSGLS